MSPPRALDTVAVLPSLVLAQNSDMAPQWPYSLADSLAGPRLSSLRATLAALPQAGLALALLVLPGALPFGALA